MMVMNDDDDDNKKETRDGLGLSYVIERGREIDR